MSDLPRAPAENLSRCTEVLTCERRLLQQCSIELGSFSFDCLNAALHETDTLLLFVDAVTRLAPPVSLTLASQAQQRRYAADQRNGHDH